MKILVATNAGQGRRHADLFEAIEGEMVVLELCSDSCGPRFATFRGVESGRSTTTALLVDRPEFRLSDLLKLIELDHAKHFGLKDLSEMEDFHCTLIRETIAFQCSLNSLEPGYIVRRKGLEITAKKLLRAG